MGWKETEKGVEEFIEEIPISPEAKKLAAEILKTLQRSEDEILVSLYSGELEEHCQKIVDYFPGVKILGKTKKDEATSYEYLNYPRHGLARASGREVLFEHNGYKFMVREIDHLFGDIDYSEHEEEKAAEEVEEQKKIERYDFSDYRSRLDFFEKYVLSDEITNFSEYQREIEHQLRSLEENRAARKPIYQEATAEAWRKFSDIASDLFDEFPELRDQYDLLKGLYDNFSDAVYTGDFPSANQQGKDVHRLGRLLEGFAARFEDDVLNFENFDSADPNFGKMVALQKYIETFRALEAIMDASIYLINLPGI